MNFYKEKVGVKLNGFAPSYLGLHGRIVHIRESEELVAPLDVITPKSTNSLFISRENHSMGST